MSRESIEMSPLGGTRTGTNGEGHGGLPLKGEPTPLVPCVPAKCPAELSRRITTFEEASAVFVYEPETGLLRWRLSAGPGRPAGKAVSLRTIGTYIVVNVGGFAYKAHRLAWLLHHGHWPEFEIDHINGARTDNRIANLRDVPHRVNAMNQKCHRRFSVLAPARALAEVAHG